MLKKMDRTLRRRLTAWMLSALAALLLSSEPMKQLCSLPDSILLTRGHGTPLSLSWPLDAELSGDAAALSSMDETLKDESHVYLTGQDEGAASLTVRLLGLLPFKRIPVSVQEERVLIPGGSAVGVAIRTQGVLVVGASDLGGSSASPARMAGLLPGDLIQAVDGTAVTSARGLSGMITSDETVVLTVLRDGEILSIPLKPVADPRDGVYRLGVWVRDSTAGIGTLSFYDPETGRFAALGHAITDIDTGMVLDVQEGEIAQSRITEIHKGERGAPGELVGEFSGSATLGEIKENSVYGIYGSAYEPMGNILYPEGIPVLSRDEVHLGAAQLLTTLDETGVHAYDCEIVRLARQDSPAQRSMVIRVTDPELLEKTGGIVQGMSGSPIIQDGRLAGAVTHVYVNDPTAGYGLYVDWMIDRADRVG